MSTLIFSNADYYKNEIFQELMREWNNLDYYKDDQKIFEAVVENLTFDFYRASLEWLKRNYDEDDWKFGLE
jgi:hypothetical protein